MSNPYATECAIYRFFSEEFFSEDGVEKSHFCNLRGKKIFFYRHLGSLPSAYQTPLKAVLLHYVSQLTPKR